MSETKKAIEFRAGVARVVIETLEINEYGQTRRVRFGVESDQTKKGVSIELDQNEWLNLKCLMGAI